MPLTSAKWLYPLAIGLACLIQWFYPHFAEQDYLNARYARNITSGAGFVYNYDEQILLTPAPLLVLSETIFPADISPLLAGFWMGIALAGFIRLLKRENLPILLAFPILLVEGSGLALVALTLLSLDLLKNPRWLSICLGLMLLVSPLGIIWVILIAIQVDRLNWGIILIPFGLWWGGAWFYFESISVQFEAEYPINLLILLLTWLVMGIWFVKSGQALIIWGSLYTLIAPNLTFPLLLCLFLSGYLHQQKPFRWANLILLSGLLGILIIALPPKHPNQRIDSSPSVGYFGSYQDAFFYSGSVYELSGRDHPNLRGLSPAEIIIATTPQKLVFDELPNDPNLQLLAYQDRGDYWEREMSVSPWEKTQPVNLELGRDMRLTGITQTEPFMRLRLDWELSATPKHPIILNLQPLDFQQVSYGFSEQIFPPEKWASLKTTTYHTIPLQADLPAGRYQVQLTLGYDGGIIAQQNITQFKIPLHTPIENLPDSSLMQLGDLAKLWSMDVQEQGNQLQIQLIWGAENDFDADYTVFIHLTYPDDPNPLRQTDIIPLDGRYPTSLWEKGEVIPLTVLLPIESIPAGDYLLRVGLYHPELGRLGDSFNFPIALP